MVHNRKYVPGGVALMQGRLRNTNHAMVQDDIEDLIVASNFLDTAPFKWIGLMYRYGVKNDLVPKYGRIDKKDGELPIAIELKMDILQWADQHDIELLKEIFMIAALEALIHVGKKYNLPIDAFVEERKKCGVIPESIEECQARKSSGVRSREHVGAQESILSSSSNHGRQITYEEPRAKIYNEEDTECDDQVALIIEYKLGSEWGTDEDLRKRHALEDRLERALGERELGYCDGGSIGSGTMEVCCYVVDYDIAEKVIEEDLKGTEFADYERIYEEDA